MVARIIIKLIIIKSEGIFHGVWVGAGSEENRSMIRAAVRKVLVFKKRISWDPLVIGQKEVESSLATG